MKKNLSRRSFVKTCAGGTILASLSRLRGRSPAPAGKFNILSIAIDDLRPELGCYGVRYAQSPNIDRLARSGIVMERAYCQQALCAPSRASLLSGARPDSTQVFDLYTDFRAALPRIESLPEFFKHRGYFSEGLGKVFHVDDVRSWSSRHPERRFGPSNPAPPAPLYSDAAFNRSLVAAFERAKAAGLSGTMLERSARGPAYEMADVPDDALPDGMLAREGIETLRSLAGRSQPFFLAVGFHKPHLPFVAPRRYWNRYDPAALPLASHPFRPHGSPAYAFDSGEFYAYRGVPPQRPIPDEYARVARHGYLAGVSYVDAQIGRLLDELDRLKLAQNTIVVLWADHGWKLGEHGEWAKLTNFEEDTHVPLILRIPGLKAGGARVSGLVESIDIYPTLVELAGFSPPPHLEGTSFVPLLRQPDRPWKTAVFSQHPREADGLRLMGRALRTERYRFVRWTRREDPRKVTAVELYDHARDAGENTNVAGRKEYADTVRDLSARLDAGWRAARPGAPDVTSVL